jgi:hypothetical protein
MSATVTAMRGTRLATIPDLDAGRRAVLLEQLGREVIRRQDRHEVPLDAMFITLVLRGLCPEPMKPEAQAEGFREFVNALLLERDCKTGWVSWQQVEPALTCTNRQEAACEMARDWAAGVLMDLVNGTYQIGGN